MTCVEVVTAVACLTPDGAFGLSLGLLILLVGAVVWGLWTG